MGSAVQSCTSPARDAYSLFGDLPDSCPRQPSVSAAGRYAEQLTFRASAQSEADAEYARNATLPPLQSVMELTSAWRAPARGADPDAVPSASPGMPTAQKQT